jgi:hypothetical protein
VDSGGCALVILRPSSAKRQNGLFQVVLPNGAQSIFQLADLGSGADAGKAGMKRVLRFLFRNLDNSTMVEVRETIANGDWRRVCVHVWHICVRGWVWLGGWVGAGANGTKPVCL